MKPIIILGAPRSGTTFLGEVLSQHPDLYFAIEPSPIWRFGNESKSDYLKPSDITKGIYRHIHCYFDSCLRKSGKERLLEKTPHNSLRPYFVDSVFPNAVYVHIIRNGFESALSIQKHWGSNTSGFKGVRISQRLNEMSIQQIPKYGLQFAKRIISSKLGLKTSVHWGPLLPGGKKMLKEYGVLNYSALQWRQCVETVCHFGKKIGSDRYFEIKLEEITEDTIREICQFCDLTEGSDHVLEAYNRKFRQEEVSYRKETMDQETLNQIKEIIEPTMNWLGY